MTKFFAILLALVVVLIMPTALYAKDYIIPIVIDGQTYSVTVSVEDNAVVTATSAITGATIGAIVAVDPPVVETEETIAEDAGDLTCADVVKAEKEMTRAQWLKHIETAVKTQHISWEGTIDRVEGKGPLTLGNYPVYINVGAGCTVYQGISDEAFALSLEPGQRVRVSGVIEDLVSLFGITFYAHENGFEVELIDSLGSTQTEMSDGFYTVGSEIEAGLWETSDGFDDCYWALLDDSQSTIRNHYGVSGGLILISEDASELEVRGCGFLAKITDEYNKEKIAKGTLDEPKGDGFYTVGVEISTGKWETENGHNDCYWALLDHNQDTLKNHYGPSGGMITLTDEHTELEIRGCGMLSPQ